MMNDLRRAVTGLLRCAIPPALGAALSVSAAAQGTWQRVEPLPSQPPLAAVTIPSSGVAVAVSPYIMIARSSDGGATWEDRNPNMPMSADRGLYGVAFADANTGVAVGNMHAITRTTDGGNTWTYLTMELSENNNLRNPVFRGDLGLVVGYGLARSTDRGLRWTSIPFMDEGNLTDIAAIDDTTIIGVGPMGLTGAGTIVKSTDGGGAWSWAFSPPGGFYPFHAIAISGLNGAVVGGGGVIFNTTDGGATWTRAQYDMQYDLLDVAYADANTAFAVGTMGTILRTSNGGRSWSPESSPVTVTLRGVAVRGALAIAVGDSGTIVRNTAVAASVGGARAEASGVSLDVLPNPSRGDASVAYRLDRRGRVRLALVDVLGREVRLLKEGIEEIGAYDVQVSTSGLPAGRYSVRMAVDDRVEVRPFVLVR